MERKVSVIIPIYNVEKYFRKCLDSVVNQTYRNLEIILVDDGSPDGCGLICDEYAARDERITVIHKKNGGLAAAKNSGMEIATGEWITFVDADDWLDIDLYEKVMEAIGDSSPDIAVEGGYFYAYPKRDVPEVNISEPFLYTDKKDIHPIMNRISYFGLPWDKFYRLDFLRGHGLKNDVTCRAFEDYFFNFQAFDQAKSVLGVVHIGYHYRQEAEGNAFSRGYNPNKPQYNYDYICKLKSYVNEHGLGSEMSELVDVQALQAISVAMECYYMHPANKKSRHEIVREFRNMKTWPHFHEAIWSGKNSLLSIKQKILKISLRLPWFWTTSLLYAGNRWLRRRKTRRS